MYQLVVSEHVTFVARIALLDGEQDADFALRLKAKRLPVGVTLQEALRLKPLWADFLAERGTQLLAWEGEGARAPLVDAEGKPAPANAEALAVLLAQPGAAHAVAQCYIDAVSVKAKLGN